MPEQENRTNPKIVALGETLKSFSDKPRQAFAELSQQVEQKHETLKTKNFLAGLNEDLTKEWVNTTDYNNLVKKTLRYDADVSMKDAKYLVKVPREHFVEAAKLSVEIAELQKQEKELKNMNTVEFSEEALKEKSYRRVQQEKKIEDLSELMKNNKVATELFKKIGIIDSIQFGAWLLSSDEAKEFVYGPFKDMEEYFVWKLVKEHGGTYEIPEGTKDNSWFY